MAVENSFKLSAPYDKRVHDSRRIRDKYPDRIPVICEVAKSSSLSLDKCKYLVPHDITVGQFQYILRKKIPNLTADQGLYMFVNNSLPTITSEMSILYNEKKDDDGFLYIIINTESTFGKK
jgi:GABA(A) receptor-associated protein